MQKCGSSFLTEKMWLPPDGKAGAKALSPRLTLVGPPVAGGIARVIGGVGSQDAEYPGSIPKTSPFHFQQQLTRVVDRCVAPGFVERYTAQQRWDEG